MDFLTFTMVYERSAASGWTGYVRVLPRLGKVQGHRLREVQRQLACQLVDLVWRLPDQGDICFSSEFYYRLPPRE